MGDNTGKGLRRRGQLSLSPARSVLIRGHNFLRMVFPLVRRVKLHRLRLPDKGIKLRSLSQNGGDPFALLVFQELTGQILL